MIDKSPTDPTRFRLDRRFTRSARTAFAHLLAQLPSSGRRLLLPAYVGVSPLEGSGVYDPVVEASVEHAFYRLRPDLSVDVDDLTRRLQEAPAFAVLLIHYFGAPQPDLVHVRALAHDHDAALIEDCAHCVSTDVGDVGDYALYSIHKILAVPTGGYLRINDSEPAVPDLPEAIAIDPEVLAEFHAASWAEIARARVRNYKRLAAQVTDIEGVELLWDRLAPGAVPHTLPVLLRGVDRYEVYKRMRAAGVGVVALYHTLVDAITPDEFPTSHAISRTILNLPIHQDLEPSQLDTVAQQLRAAMVE